MLAYLTALRLDQGLLIYAAGEDLDHHITVPFADKRIHIKTVVISKPPNKVLEQTGALSEFVRVLASRAEQSSA
jgi:5-methylcytosine-specific restriction enzyme subunit McrC